MQAEEQMVPWEQIKTEFISGSMSYKALAEKYGVSYNTLKGRGRFERWPQKRQQFSEATLEKSLNLIGDRQAQALARVDLLADRLLDRLETAIGELNSSVVQHREKGEAQDLKWEKTYEEALPGGPVDRQGLKVLTGCLKDLKQIKAVLSEGEMQEQEARIRKLRKDAKEEETREITVTLQGDLRDYSV